MTKKSSLKSFFLELLHSLISICLSILVGAVVILIVGENPINAFGELFKGAYGNRIYIANTLSRAVPLIFCGLSVALSQRCGIFNIGAEVQLHLGAMAVAITGLYLGDDPREVAIPVLIIVGFLGGVLGGLCVGVLKSRFQISEVTAAIMLNYVFKLFTSWLASGPFTSGETSVQTIKLSESLSLTTLVKNSKLTTSVFLALIPYDTFSEAKIPLDDKEAVSDFYKSLLEREDYTGISQARVTTPRDPVDRMLGVSGSQSLLMLDEVIHDSKQKVVMTQKLFMLPHAYELTIIRRPERPTSRRSI